MTLRTRPLSYSADGLAMTGHFFFDDRIPSHRPGILVFPDALGLGPHVKARAERLAKLGYTALACDLHGEERLYRSLEEVGSFLAQLRASPARIRARAQGALDALAAQPEVDGTRVAAIGYCFGGTMALELARSGAPLACAVGLHSGLATKAPEDARNIRGKILVCIGADDPAIPSAQREDFAREMGEAGVDWQIHLYGGVVHSFTNPDAGQFGRPDFARYDAVADRRSWLTTTLLFDEVFD